MAERPAQSPTHLSWAEVEVGLPLKQHLGFSQQKWCSHSHTSAVDQPDLRHQLHVWSECSKSRGALDVYHCTSEHNKASCMYIQGLFPSG